MSKAIKCDRCGGFEVIGELLPNGPRSGQWSLVQYEYGNWEHKDLCKNCREQLALWFNDKTITFNKTPILNEVGYIESQPEEVNCEEEKQSLDDRPLEEIGIDELLPMLSIRAWNVLHRLHFNTLSDIVREFSLEKLRKCKNVGPKIETEIVNVLGKFNIMLPETDDDHDNLPIWFYNRSIIK